MILGVILLSCNTPKQATKAVQRLMIRQPGAAAEEFRRLVPCRELALIDTAWVVSDSLIYVECPEWDEPTTDIPRPNNGTAGEYIARVDTVTRVVRKTVRVPVLLPVKTSYITKYVKDWADSLVIVDLNKRLTDQVLKASDLRGKFNMWKWIAIGLMAVIGVWGIFKIKSLL